MSNVEPIRMVHYLRSRRPGPEQAIEDAVARNIEAVVRKTDHEMCVIGSPTVGAGIPDLVAVTCSRGIADATKLPRGAAWLLGYIRSISRIRAETLSERLGWSVDVVRSILKDLQEADAVEKTASSYSLSEHWRSILPTVVAVEAKCSDWKRAIAQANRNTVFCHQSYVALPDRVAERVCNEDRFRVRGIGLLSVSVEGQLTVLRRARSRSPSVWSYYYDLASSVARELESGSPSRIDERGIQPLS